MSNGSSRAGAARPVGTVRPVARSYGRRSVSTRILMPLVIASTSLSLFDRWLFATLLTGN